MYLHIDLTALLSFVAQWRKQSNSHAKCDLGKCDWHRPRGVCDGVATSLNLCSAGCARRNIAFKYVASNRRMQSKSGNTAEVQWG